MFTFEWLEGSDEHESPQVELAALHQEGAVHQQLRHAVHSVQGQCLRVNSLRVVAVAAASGEIKELVS